NQDESGEAACYVSADDTRVTPIWVPSFKGPEIPKDTLLKFLDAEAPAFLNTLLNLTLPTAQGRLKVPVVETEEKKRLQTNNAPLLEFVDQCLVIDDEARTAKTAMYERYRKWADAHFRECLDQR